MKIVKLSVSSLLKAYFKKISQPSAFLVLLLLFLFANDSLGQASFQTARHETGSQREVDVTFNQAVTSGAPTATGWTVTINGVGVPFVVTGNFGPNTIRIQFDASGIVGHTAGQTFLKPTETLRVQYNGTGAVTSAGGVNNTGLQVSQNNTPFTCAELIFFQQGNFTGVDVCSPVVMNFYQYQFKSSLRFRNSGAYDATKFRTNISWGDATNTNGIAFYVSDLVGVANSTFIDNTGFTGSNPAIILTQRPNHTYPAANPTDCSFNASITPLYDGVAFCPGQATTTLFATYDTDNANSGVLSLPPSVPGSDLVCLGNNVNMFFTDATSLNCRQAIEPILPNDQARHIRIVYGSTNNGGVGNIPDIRVTLPAILGGGTTTVTNNNATGTLIAGAFIPTAVGAADFNGVITLPTPVTAATALTYMGQIRTTLTNNQAVGQRFYVRLDYWDICNPYNAITPNSPAPVSIENFVQIIDSPNPPTVNNPSVCETAGNGSYNITATGLGAGTLTYTWYRDAALTQILQGPNTDNTFNPVTDGPAPLLSTTVSSSQTFNYYVTVTQGSNNCTSQPRTITIRIDDQNTAGAIAHPLGASPITVCSGVDPAAFTSTTAGTGGGPDGADADLLGDFTYQWQSATNAAFTAGVTTVGTNSPTFDPPAVTGTIFYRRQVISGNCATVSTTPIEFRADTPVQAGTIGNPQIICSGQTPTTISNVTSGSGGTGTTSYSWQFSTDNFGADINTTGTNGATFSPGALTVTTYYRRVNTSGVCIPTSATSNVVVITVQPVINPGAIAGNQTICAEGDPAAFTSTTGASGGNGALTYQWQSASNAAFTVGVTNVGTNSPTFDPPAGLTATTFYRRVASGGPCTAQPTSVLQVTVNPLPTASVSGGGSICSGVPASDIEFALTGVGPWNLVYAIGGTLQPAVNGITTSPYVISTPGAGIYTIVSVQDSNTPACTVTAPHANITGTATVTTQTVAPPTVDSFTAQAPVCDNGAGTNPPDAILDLQPNSVQPYAITYRLRRVSTNTFLAGSINFTGSSDAAGIVNLAPTYAQLGAAPTDPQGYQVVITAIQNTATLCAGAVPINGPILIVNPRPAAPTGAVPGIACSTAGSGAAISVTVPAVGFTIVWSTTAAPTFTAAAGNSATGTRGNIFIPTSNATVTYHAFTRDDVTPTNCLSAASLSVQHTQDVTPTTSVAGGAQANCNGTFVLAANTPNAGNFEVGTWTVPGIAYTQLFNYASGTTTSAAVNGWSRDISGAGVFAGGTGSFQVNGNQFEANNIDGAGGAGAEAVWLSPVVNVATMPNLSISINLSSTNTHEAGDYLRVFYKLNGGAEIALTNGTQNGNITGTVTATAAGLTGTTIQLVVRANNGQTDETYRFDNILIATATAPTISDQNSRTATVTNLPVGPNVLTWTITSRFGVCTPSATTVTLTRHPLPTVNTITTTLCEDTFGGASTANVNLSQYDISVSDEPGAPVAVPNNTTVEYYSANTRLPANQITAPTTILNNQVVFTRVRNSSTTCTSDGTITFTVRTLPAKQDLTRQVCEDAPPGSLVASGINLQNFETAIANGSMAGRNIEWYEDAALTVLIPAGNAAGAEQNYSINADKTIHAKIIDTGSPTTPQCFRQATLALDYQPRPSNNQISDGIGQVLGATYTVCASSNLVLLQLNPGTNPGSTITWTVPPPSYAGEFELLTGTTGFFIILRFPNPIPGTGTLYPTGVPISVKETLGTVPCDGNTINTRIVVEGSPPKPIITGPPTVCTNANGVVFTVTNPVAGTYSWTLPAGATITSLPVTASSITVQMSTFSGNVSVTHSSGTGCTSPASDLYPVAVANRPSITSSNAATLCSGQNVSAVYTLTSNIVPTTYNWDVITVTGAVTGTNLGNSATGVTSINETLVNTSGVTASVTYRVTPIGPGPDNCPGTPLNVTITVNPQPVLVAGQTKTICSGAAAAKEILLIPANLPAGTLFNWPDPDGGGPATAGVNIPMGTAGTVHINDVLTNLTNSPITINYVITPTSGANCPGVSQTVAIIVNPQPVGHNDTTPIACSGLPAGYDLELNIADTGAGGNNLITGTTYSWVATANGNVTGESTTPQSGKIVSDVLRNITNANQVVRYTITPTSAASCVGAAFTVDITVRPEPRGFNDASPLICSDGTVNYNLSNNIANTGAGGNNLVTGTTYSWVATANANVSGESTTPQTTATISDALNNITNSSQVVVYTVTPTSALGCAGNSFTVSVTVRPEPKGYNDATPIICSDASVNYNLEANILNTGLGGNGLISGTTYAWNAIANANVTGEGNGTGQTITNALNNITNINQVVVYEVIPTSGNGCAGDMFTVSVTVRPEPRGYNDNTPVICSDASVNYILSTNIANTGLGGNNLVTGTTYTWIATSNTNVGGESTTSQSGGTITDVLNNVTNSNQVVTYTVTPTSAQGCVGDQFTVAVTVRPEPRGYNDNTPIRCSDVTINYNLTANVANVGLGGNNLVTGTTFSWVAASNATVAGESTTPQAGTSITDVVTNITNSNQVVVYTVTPTSANGCVGNDFTVSVTIRPEPRGYNDNSPVACSDVNINYVLSTNVANTGLGGNNLVTGTTYSWVAAANANVLGESTTPIAGGTINDVVNNVTTSDQVVVYTVTPSSADGCAGDPFIVSVTIRPEPRGYNDTTPFVCSDVAIGYDLVANVANTGLGGNNLVTGTTYSWVATANANVTGESTTPQTGSTITDIVNNVTNAIQVVTYTVTPTSAQGCAGNTFTVAVTVRPEPRGHNDNTPIVCSDAPANYNLTSNVADTGAGGNNLVTGTTFSWVAASNSNVGGESTTLQAGATITDVLTNSTNGNQVVVYTVTPTSADGCVGNNFTVSINVRPEPKGFDDNTPVVCSDVIINYDLVSNITNTASGGNNLAVGTTYSWIAANNPNTTGESTSAKTGSIINDIVNNVTNANEIVVYTVTPTSINGCVGDPFLVSVTIRPEPRGFNDNTPLICSDATLNYDLELNVANTVSGGNNLVTGTTYSWIATSNTNVGGESTSAQAGSVITDILNNVTNANQVVVYSVTPTSALGCAGNVFTVSVTVRPEPRGYNDNTPVICSDATVAYDLAANVGNTGLGGNNLVTGTTYSWEAAANPNVTGESTTPQAGSTITDALNNVTNSNQTVVYTVTATSGNGCVGNPFTVTVTVRPEPKGFDDSSPIVCSDVNINYDLVANISNIPLGGNSLIVGTTYSWVAASNPNVTGESTSPQTGNTINNVINNVTNGNEIVVYTVTPTSINGCVGNPFLVSVTVRPEPRGHNDNTPLICSDDNVNYDLIANVANTGLGGNNLVTGTTYSWIATANANVTGESTLPQAGSTINDVLNNVTTANQVVVYSVTPTSGNACVGNVFTVSVTVRPEPRGYNDNTPVICSDDPAGVNYNLANNVANVGLGGNNLVTGTTYSWVAAANANVGGESTTPIAGGTITDVLNNVTNSNQIVVYTVTPTSALGCVGNNFTVSITVRPEPRGFNDNSSIVCSDLAVNYNLVANISNIGMGGNNLVTGTTFSWIATANANVTGESDLIAGTSSTITDVINNVTNADQVVVYTVTPTSSDGCVGNTFTVSVTVRPEPKGFNDNTPLACSDVAFNYDLVANIANTGLGGNNLVTGTTYSWIATPNPNVTGEGNGTTSTITDVINNVTNVNQVVVYTVTPTSGNSCVGNTFTVSVTIRPEPRGFNDNTPVICSDEPTGVNYNLNANIANTVSGGNNLVTGTTYSWIATSNTNVAGESTSAQAGATISDVLTNITNVNQVVVYTVTPTSGNGCAGNPFIVSVTVRPEPRGFNDTKIICSDANVNYDLPTNIANTGSGGNNLLIGTSYSWIAIDNPNVTGETTVTPGTTITINDVLNNVTAVDQPVVYNVVATSNNGCPGDMFTVTITVRPEPKGFNDNSPIICSDANVNYDLELNIANTGSGGNNLITGTTYSWIATANANVGGESTTAQAGSVINDVLNNVTNVNQVVVYTVTPTSALGCVGNNFTVSVTVRPEPRGFNDNSPSICSKANVNYDLSANIANTVSGGNNLVAGTTYSWVAADNSNVTGESLAPVTTATITDVLTNVTGSNQVVVYTITPTSGNSCVGNDFTVSVTVRPEPIGLADADDVCSDEGINYNIQTRNINLLGNSVSSQFTYTVVSSDPGNVSVAGKNRPVASNASITDTYTNITSNDVLITYTITPFSATGTCQGTNFDVVFTIHPEPLGPNTTIQRCSDDPVNFDLQDVIDTPTTGNSVPSKFRYSVSSNNPLAVAPGANRNTPTTALITDVYTNLTNADVEITYTVTPSSLADDCEGSVFTFKVIVHPEPVGANVTDPVCSTSLNYNIQTQNINTLGNAVPSVFTYTVVSTDPVGVPPAANRAVASNAPITDAYVNATGVDVTITYTITPISSAHTCAGTPFTYAVTIRSKPDGNDATKADVCSDVPFSFDPQNDIVNSVVSTFTWTATYDAGLSVNGAVPPANGTGVISGHLTNTGNTTLEARYVVTATAGTCVGDPYTITVPILPEPVVATNLNEIVCSRLPYNKLLDTNGVSVGAANYDITAVVDAGLTGIPTTGNGLLANALLNDAFVNVTAIPQKVTYTITPHGTNGCVGDPKIVELTVNPEPVVNPALDNTVCSREISGIILSTNGTSVAANSYRLVSVAVPGTITADPLNVLPATTGNINLIRNDKYINSTSAPVVVTYEIIGISPLGCEGQPEFIDLTISPEPIMTPGVANQCSDLLSGIIVGPAVGSTVTTSFELKNVVKAPALVAGSSNAGLGTYPANLAGGQSDFLSNDTFTNTTAGPLVVTYTIVPIAGTCRGQDQTVVFTVNPAPAVAVNLNRVVCSEDASGIVFNTAPSSAAAADYRITNIVLSPSALFTRVAGNATFPRSGVPTTDIQNDAFRNHTNVVQTVTYTVQARTAAGCFGPARDIVLTVEPMIRVVDPANEQLCSGQTTAITLNSPSVPSAGQVTFNYTAAPSAPGMITITALNNLPQGFVIADAPVNNTNVPQTITYTITPVAVGAKSGSGCTTIPAVEPQTVVVTIEPKPRLIPTRIAQTTCEGVALTGITLNSSTTPSASNGTVIFDLVSVVDPGTSLPPANVTGFSAVGTDFTPGQALIDVLSNTSSTTQVIRYTFRPQFSAGLVCVGDDVTIDVTITPSPVVTAVPAVPPAVCSNGQLVIDLTTDTDPLTTIVTWTTSVSSPDVIGASAGAGNQIFQTLINRGTVPHTVTYNITPRLNGCAGTMLPITVTVNPLPVINPPPRATVCGGNAFVLNLLPFVNTNPAQSSFEWTVFDVNGIGTPGQFDGSGTGINQPLSNPNDFSATLIYTITPIGPGGCRGLERNITVTVAPVIDARFLTTDEGFCAGTPIFLTFELDGQAPFNFSYRETTSSGSVIRNVVGSGNVRVERVTPAVSTRYEILSAVDALGCPMTFTTPPQVNITIFRTVTAGWTAVVPPLIGGSSVVTFTNTSVPIDPAEFRYEWTFGNDLSPNPQTATGVGPFNVNYDRQGDHFVTLRAVNVLAEAAGKSCESTFSQRITIPILPLVANFIAEPKRVCFPSTITVTSNTSTGDIMEWRVVDQNGRTIVQSNLSLPEFLITSPGSYSIFLTTRDSRTGATANTQQTDFEVFANPVASFDLRPNIVHVPDTKVTTFNFSTGATDYLWDFGDGGTSDLSEPEYTYKVEGQYDVTLVAMNDHGGGVVCRDTLVRQVTAKQGGVTKVPNAFTPNLGGPNGGVSGGGGSNGTFNDVFLPIVKGAEEFNLQIFDRWGNLIFESNSSTIGWDGYNKDGKIMPAGVYVYKLTLRLSDGQRTTQIGDITMIR